MSSARSRSRSPVDSRSRSGSRSPSRNSSRLRAMQTKRCIISNIPYEMKWQDIKDLFRKEVGDVLYVELFNFPDGKPKGSGVIEFKDKETAAYAIDKMHRTKVKDRNLVVREERERDRQQNMGGGGMGMGGGGMGMGAGGGGGMGMGGGGGMGMGGGGMGMGGGAMMGGGGGVSPQVLQQLGIEGPVSNTVFVSNLDYKVTWKKLKDVFKLAGNVQRAEIKQDKEGKSRGIGTVSFEHPMEAVQAVSMFNNQTLFDRNMHVKMDSLGAVESKAAMQLPSGLKSIGMGLGAGGTPLHNLSQIGNMDGGMGMGSGSGMGMGGGSGMGMGAGSGMGMGGSGMGMGGMDSGMRSGMGNSMGTGMSGMGGNMGSSMMGMSGNMGSSGMGSTGMGMSSSMGSGMGSSVMGMGDSFNSPMSQMGGSSGYMNTSMGGGMSDNFSSIGGMSGFGGNSSFSSMMDSAPRGGGRSMTSSSYSRSSDYGRDRDRSGSSSDKLRDMRTRPDEFTIIVKNLPYSYTWQTLRDKFKEVGDIKFAEIKTENGRSAGWGLVRYNNQDDAMRAIEVMNRSKLDGREVDVRIFRG